MFLLITSCAATTKPNIKTKERKCAPVVVFENSYPTCTFTPIGEIEAKAVDKASVMRSIQSQVCSIGGHALVDTKTEWKNGILTRKGTAVHCNVPFLLSSDMRPRN